MVGTKKGRIKMSTLGMTAAEKMAIVNADFIVCMALMAVFAICCALYGIRRYNIRRKKKTAIKLVNDRKTLARKYFNAYAAESCAEDRLRATK